jgi:hypothetical protein
MGLGIGFLLDRNTRKKTRSAGGVSGFRVSTVWKLVMVFFSGKDGSGCVRMGQDGNLPFVAWCFKAVYVHHTNFPQ